MNLVISSLFSWQWYPTPGLTPSLLKSPRREALFCSVHKISKLGRRRRFEIWPMWHYVYTPCTKKTLGFPAVATLPKSESFLQITTGPKYILVEKIFLKLLCWTLEFWISHSRREERRMRFFSSLDALERCNFAKEKHSNASLGASLECRGAARLTIFAQKKLKTKEEQNLHFNSLSQNCPKNSIFCQITVWIFGLKFLHF